MRGLLVVVLPILVGVGWWFASPPTAAPPDQELPQVVGGKGFTPGKFLKPRAIAVDERGTINTNDNF